MRLHIASCLLALVTATAGAVEPPSSAAFLPGGFLGIQPGSGWESSKKNPALERLQCQPIADGGAFEEICFFKAAKDSRISGAAIHDGFIVRKADRVVLIGTGIPIKNPDDPLAEAVIQGFHTQTRLAYQQQGSVVLFLQPPAVPVPDAERDAYADKDPVLLIKLDAAGSELAVFYGYLSPVNAFAALTAR